MGNNTKNKLMDLNDHLFEQMERLNDNALKGDGLKREITRSKAMSSIASQIINNARTCIAGMTAFNEGLIKKPPLMLGFEAKDEI